MFFCFFTARFFFGGGFELFWILEIVFFQVFEAQQTLNISESCIAFKSRLPKLGYAIPLGAVRTFKGALKGTTGARWLEDQKMKGF